MRDKEDGLFRGEPVLLYDYEELNNIMLRSVNDPTRKYVQEKILTGMILFPDDSTKMMIIQHILNLCPLDNHESTHFRSFSQ